MKHLLIVISVLIVSCDKSNRVHAESSLKELYSGKFVYEYKTDLPESGKSWCFENEQVLTEAVKSIIGLPKKYLDHRVIKNKSGIPVINSKDGAVLIMEKGTSFQVIESLDIIATDNLAEHFKGEYLTILHTQQYKLLMRTGHYLQQNKQLCEPSIGGYRK